MPFGVWREDHDDDLVDETSKEDKLVDWQKKQNTGGDFHIWDDEKQCDSQSQCAWW